MLLQRWKMWHAPSAFGARALSTNIGSYFVNNNAGSEKKSVRSAEISLRAVDLRHPYLTDPRHPQVESSRSLELSSVRVYP
jgi:hypothetical protein